MAEEEIEYDPNKFYGLVTEDGQFGGYSQGKPLFVLEGYSVVELIADPSSGPYRWDIDKRELFLPEPEASEQVVEGEVVADGDEVSDPAPEPDAPAESEPEDEAPAEEPAEEK